MTDFSDWEEELDIEANEDSNAQLPAVAQRIHNAGRNPARPRHHRACPIVRRHSPSRGSVEERFNSILASPIRKAELIVLQMRLFADIIPPFTRAEKRGRSALLASYEARRTEVLARLQLPVNVQEFLKVALATRRISRDA
jgi:hypothetical protein